MQAACEAVMQSPSEDNVVRLLELWSPEWKHRGRQRTIGSGSYEQYCTLGLFAYGGNDPCLSKASANRAACVALNHFLRSRFLDGTWTSIAVVLNPRIGLHRDILNMIGKPNHAIALGSFTGGRIWVEDDHGTSPELRVTKRNTQQLWGSWIDRHDMPVSFDARRFHKVEPHEGRMWAVAACTPQAFKRCSPENRDAATVPGFPVDDRCDGNVPAKAPSEGTKPLREGSTSARRAPAAVGQPKRSQVGFLPASGCGGPFFPAPARWRPPNVASQNVASQMLPAKCILAAATCQEHCKTRDGEPHASEVRQRNV